MLEFNGGTINQRERRLCPSRWKGYGGFFSSGMFYDPGGFPQKALKNNHGTCLRALISHLFVKPDFHPHGKFIEIPV